MKIFRIAASIAKHATESKDADDFERALFKELRSDPAKRVKPEEWVHQHLKVEADAGSQAEVEKVKKKLLDLLRESEAHWYMMKDPAGEGIKAQRRVWGPSYDRNPNAPKYFGYDWYQHLMSEEVYSIMEYVEKLYNKAD